MGNLIYSIEHMSYYYGSSYISPYYGGYYGSSHYYSPYRYSSYYPSYHYPVTYTTTTLAAPVVVREPVVYTAPAPFVWGPVTKTIYLDNEGKEIPKPDDDKVKDDGKAEDKDKDDGKAEDKKADPPAIPADAPVV